MFGVRKFVLIPLLLSFLGFGESIADDHIDGPTISELPADLAGIYVFQSKSRLFKNSNKSNLLTLVLNTQSGVRKNGVFDLQSKFVLDLRSLHTNCSGDDCNHGGSGISHKPALRVECFGSPNFTSGFVLSAQYGLQCKFLDKNGNQINKDEFVTGFFDKKVDLRNQDDHKFGNMYTGQRADPFFISLPTFNDIVFYDNKYGTVRDRTKTKEDGTPAYPHNLLKEVSPHTQLENTEWRKAPNGVKNVNVLSIVIELDLKKIGLENGLYGLAAESYLWKPTGQFSNRGYKYKKVDRAGRAELINVGLQDPTQSLFHGAGDTPLKLKANYVEVFSAESEAKSMVKVRLKNNFKKYDSYDGITDWSDQGLDHLVNLFGDDYIMINVQDSCYGRSSDYLGIERNLLNNKEITSCGGRDLKDDIFAKSYSLYMGGPNSSSSRYKTGINKPYESFHSRKPKDNDGKHGTVRVQDVFPYLAKRVRVGRGETIAGAKLYCQNQEEHGADLFSRSTCAFFRTKFGDFHSKVLDGEINDFGHNVDDGHVHKSGHSHDHGHGSHKH